MPREAKKLTKSDFIRSMPDAKAQEVVDAAAKRGLSLSTKHVHVIRSSDKARARRGKPLGRPGRGPRGAAKGTEAELRRAIAELGLTTARQIFREVEAAFSR